jgi:hypothetical protein
MTVRDGTRHVAGPADREDSQDGGLAVTGLAGRAVCRPVEISRRGPHDPDV